ncbi:MAG: 50S ribosomal protein L13 [Clostridia bacterium]
MKTFMANPGNVEQKWFLVDAAGIPMGRLASQVASILRGKNNVTYTPHADCFNHVIVINAAKMVLTGKKLIKKNYISYSGFVGGLKEVQYKKLMEEKPEFAVKRAVKGMIPNSSLGRKQLSNLRIFAGAEHDHEAQKPVVVELKGGRN